MSREPLAVFPRDEARAAPLARVLGAVARYIALAGLLSTSCAKDPTEVVVTVYSDVPCDAVAAVAAGPTGELGDRPASATSTVCDPSTGSRGSLVLVPKADDSGELAVEVRLRTDQGQPDDCIASKNYEGCIVSRRILNYIPGRTVHMRVDLRNPCLNTPCSQTTSCVALGLSKACVTAHIDPTQCAGECTDADLVTQSGSQLAACAEGSNPCPRPEDCAASNAGASCVCAPGYVNPPDDRTACVDLNECALTPAPCDAHAACTNTDGGFSCTCNTAYEGDGETCHQARCETLCDPHATCSAQGKAFQCSCDAGFSGDGATCTDIDECAEQTADCAPLAACANTEGAYECTCPDGYEGDGATCIDIDECAEQTATCDPLAACANTEGGYGCTCPDGYEGDGATCTDIDECAEQTATCDPLATCINTDAGYECQCPTGYEGDGDAAGAGCVDIDECALSPTTCGENTDCTNTVGSYACQCSAGFTGTPGACTCDSSVNASLVATATASSTYPGYGASYVNDGDESTLQTSATWCNDWPVTFPQWLELDFPTTRTIGRVEVFTSNEYAITAYDIAAWDGSQWTTLASVEGNSDLHDTLTFSPVRTTKLRLIANHGSDQQPGYARVNELEAYCE